MPDTTTTSINLAYVVQDLDRESTYQSALGQIAAVQSNNFAVYFDHEQASAATNLTSDSLAQWVQNHENRLGTKWIHFWTDSSQRSLIEALASRYDISPRLVGLLCPHPGRFISHDRNNADVLSEHGASPKQNATDDVESLSSENGLEMRPTRRTKSGLQDVTFGDIVNDLWHFHSIDWGEKYVHVGVNVLSVVPGLPHSVAKPAGQRLWMSLVLCHDGTVISTLQRHPNVEDPEIARLANKIGKRHVLNVLSQLSRLASRNTGESSDLTGISVRPNSRTHETSMDAAYKERTECASLLFYYLFDDWMSTYALIARREHPYRENLEKVRQVLTTLPDVDVLETLHNIGRQLIVLKSMYKSYAAVVTRILMRYNDAIPQAVTSASREATRNKQAMYASEDILNQTASTPTSLFAERSPTSHQPSTDIFVSSNTTVASHPTVSSAALFRFERLLDRIDLYALSEINECLAEKESLSFMTFNLLALSESHAIEKLTRTTILLAKATILFLPASLLTAYFGISIGNISARYSLKTYWLSFLVVVVTSVVFLSLFEFATGTIQGQLGFMSLRRALWRKGVAKWIGRKKEREVDERGGGA